MRSGPRHGPSGQGLEEVDRCCYPWARRCSPDSLLGRISVDPCRYATNGIRGFDPPKVYDDGAAHIALDVQDVPAAVEAAAAHGLAPVGEIIAIDAGPNRGRKVVYLASAYGLLIELLEVPG
jgi:hypothetical protein